MGQERVSGYAEGFRIGWNKAEDTFKKMIGKKINHYRTIYGVKKETVIQSAFIYELEDLLKQIKHDANQDLNEGDGE